jgi:hypothetical protein
MPFKPGDAHINRRGRLPASTHIAATYRDLAADFPDPAPHEAALLRSAATLLYRGERCRDSAVAHRCVTEARKIISGLQTRRAVKAPPPPKPSFQERVAIARSGTAAREPA